MLIMTFSAAKSFHIYILRNHLTGVKSTMRLRIIVDLDNVPVFQPDYKTYLHAEVLDIKTYLKTVHC
jgi:hypothetical protein